MKFLNILLIVGIVVVAGAIIFSLSIGKPPPPQEEVTESGPPAAYEPITAESESTVDQTTTPVPQAKEPSALTSSPEPPSSKPGFQVSVPTGIENQFLQVFNIEITKDGFKPSSITVSEGNRVQFNVTAIDAGYDISMPSIRYRSYFSHGQPKTFGFEAPVAGTYPFSCLDACPEGKTISGELIVLGK